MDDNDQDQSAQAPAPQDDADPIGNYLQGRGWNVNAIDSVPGGRHEQANRIIEDRARLHGAQQTYVDNPNLGWRSVSEDLKRRGFSPDQYRGNYEQSLRLWDARHTDEERGDTGTQRLIRDEARVLPFVNIGYNISERAQFQQAQDRFHSGNATDDDLATIAAYERHNREEADKRSTTMGAIGQTALHLPGQIAEVLAGGRVAQATVAPLAGRLFGTGAGAALADSSNILSRAAWASPRMAALTTAQFTAQLGATPGMYVDHWQQNNLENGRDSFDVRGLPPALANAAIAQAIFGQMRSVGQGASQAAGGGILGRVVGGAAGAATGVIESNAISTIGRWAGLNTGYGTIHNLITGQPGALGDLLSEGLTFAAFAQLHHNPAGHEVMETMTSSLREAARRGESPRLVVREYRPAFEALQRAMGTEPNLTREQAQQVMKPFGKIGETMARGFPEPEGPPRPPVEQPTAQQPAPTPEAPAAPQPSPAAPEVKAPSEPPREAVAAKPESRRWQNTGTEFRDREGPGPRFEFTGSDGERYGIDHEDKVGSLDHRISIKDKDGNEVAFAGFNRNADMTYSGHVQNKTGPKGAGRAIYDYAHRAFGEIKPSELAGQGIQTKEGEAFWRRNAEFAARRQAAPEPAPRPAAPAAPKASHEDVKALAKQLGLPLTGGREAVEERIRKVGGQPLLDALAKPVERAVRNPSVENLQQAAADVGPADRAGLRAAGSSLEEVKTLQKEIANEESKLRERQPDESASLRRQINAALSEVAQASQNPPARPGGPPGNVAGQAAGSTQMGGGSAQAGGVPGPSAAAPRGQPAGDVVTPEGQFFGVKPEQRNIFQEGMTNTGQGWVGNMPQPKAAPLYTPNAPSTPARPEGAPPGWENWSSLQRQHWQRSNSPWIKENVRLRNNGERTLADEIIKRGGIDPTSLEGDLEHWQGVFGPGMFKTKGGKGQKLDVLAEELQRRFPGEFRDESVHPTERVLEMLAEHFLEDGGRAAEQLAGSEEIRKARDDFGREYFAQHPQADEAEIEAAFHQFLSEASEAAGRDGPTVQAIASATGPAREQEAAGNRARVGGRPDAGAGRGEAFEPPGAVPGEFEFGHGAAGIGAAGANPAGAPPTAAERAVLPGGGQPGAGERGRPERVTALANRVVDEERKKNGLPPIMEQARMANAVVWDRAMERLDAHPSAGEDLVKELIAKPRATTVEENALLLHRKIALANEHERVMLEYVRAFGRGGADKADAITLDSLEGREEHLRGLIDQLDKVTRSTGAEWGRAGQFRRQLAAEDYSLRGMLMRAEVANQRELTPEERARVADQQQQIAAAQARAGAAEDALANGGGGHTSPEYKDMIAARLDAENARQAFDQSVEASRRAQLPLSARMEDLIVKIRRAFVISSPKTMLKIIAATAERMLFTPIEQAAGAVWSRIPGISKIAAMAPREGGGVNTAAEKMAAFTGFTEGLKDAWANMRHGRSELDVLYGDPRSPRHWLDFVGELHAAGKAPAVRAEFTRSFLQRIDHEIAQGRDATSPAALTRIGIEAYKDSQRAKFQQDNRVVDAWKNAIAKLKGRDASFGSRAIGTAMQLAVPVVRIPTNLVAEAFQYSFGTVTGGVRAAAVLARGIESMKPEQADLIMRSLKKGSVGLAALAIGYLNPQIFGGFYSGRRDDRDVQAGGIATPMGQVPFWLLHNPLLEVFQIGATARRALDSTRRGEHPDVATAAASGILGIAEEVPMLRETSDLGRHVFATNSKTRGRYFGELIKSLAVPQALQWLAGRQDTPKGFSLTADTTRRNPQGVVQHIKTGVPFLRQTVPAR